MNATIKSYQNTFNKQRNDTNRRKTLIMKQSNRWEKVYEVHRNDSNKLNNGKKSPNN